jgi:hypothetical protein
MDVYIVLMALESQIQAAPIHHIHCGRPLGFSCRLAVLANATSFWAEMDSKTQKRPDLARRKAVNCNPLLDGSYEQGAYLIKRTLLIVRE